MNRELIKISIPILVAAAIATAVVVIDVRRTNRLLNEPPKPVEMAVAENVASPAVAPAPIPATQQTAPAIENLPQPTPPPISQAAPARPQPRIQPAQIAVSEPAAREALAGVGSDPNAEAVWVKAINDTRLTANDRRNLIEDLNETGFPNPRNLTPNDLPIIENRLALIEQLAPDAIDDTNAAAFDEAYKDLINMRARLVPQ